MRNMILKFNYMTSLVRKLEIISGVVPQSEDFHVGYVMYHSFSVNGEEEGSPDHLR